MAHEALQKIKDFSDKEITEKMRSGEIVPPKRGTQEREVFNRFLAMKKEEREKFLSESQSPAPPSPPKEGGEKKDEIPVTPPAPPVVPVPPTPPEPPKKAWYEELGYENEDKAKESHKKILELNNQLQAIIDSLNSKEGKRGDQIKALTEERERLLKELGELRKSSQPVVEKPKRPKRPNPKEYENGMLDEKYVEAVEHYETEIEAYIEKSNEFLKESLKREISETLPKQTPQVIVEPQNDDGALWDKLFDKDIPEFQKRYSLDTTVPIRRISDSFNVVDPKSKATPQERAIAQAFLDSVPKKDIDAYHKVRQAVEIAYDFSSGVPISRYRSIEGALYDYELIGEGKAFNVVRPVQLSAEEERSARERARLKNEKDVSAIPAFNLAGSDKKLSEYRTDDEKKARLQELLKLYNSAMSEGTAATKRFEQSQEYQELNKMRAEVFNRPLPSYIR
jgi:hypothetical protein